MIVTWLFVIGFALEIGCRAYLLGDDADVVILSPTPP
jgi:membrane protease YdiL (CAAX protease family)